MKTKGLGNGLGALFGDAAFEEDANDFHYLPLQRIEPRADQPRSLFEQEKIDELSDSIREHGVLSPLTVRSIGDGYYQIIAGERRWRAARAAGLLEVPARVIAADDKKATELAMVENLQREDLSPIEEARGYKSLIDDFGLTQEEVSQKVSKSRPAVANSLRLLSLPADVIDLVASGKLSAGSARALLTIKDNHDIINLANKSIENDMSVREIESLVRKMSKEPKEPDYPDTSSDVDYFFEAQNKLTETFGRRVVIKQGKDKGRIEIEYYDQDDFNVLFDALTTKSTKSSDLTKAQEAMLETKGRNKNK